MVTTGISISGKMSVRICVIDVTPRTRINSAITTKVYGRFKASLTIHMASPFVSRNLIGHEKEYRGAPGFLQMRAFSSNRRIRAKKPSRRVRLHWWGGNSDIRRIEAVRIADAGHWLSKKRSES